MPSAQSEHARRYTFEEYLELESNSEQKHEFLDGEVLAMSGASYPRVQISGNILHYLRLQFGNGPCQVFNPDLRVRQEQSRKYVYPDATVIYDEPEFDEADKARTTVNNPLAVFEVLSRSTAGYELGIKFLNYQKFNRFEASLPLHKTAHRFKPSIATSKANGFFGLCLVWTPR